MAQVETDEQLAARGIDRWGFPVQTVVLAPRPPEQLKLAQRGRGHGCNERLIPGLRRLCDRARVGQRFTRHAIAKECEVDKESIRQIEKRALKKIRSRLGPHFLKQLAALSPQFSHVTYRHVSFS